MATLDDFAGVVATVSLGPCSRPETPTEAVSAPKSALNHPTSSLSTPRLHFVSTPSRRLPKFTRAKPSWRPHLVLQDRDLELLKAVEEYRLLSTPQILLLFLESRDGIYRRLQLLFHHGYVDRLKGDPTAPMVYSLGRRGAEALVERGVIDEVPANGRCDVRHRYVAHQSMIADFRIALSLAIRARDDVELVTFQREGRALRDRVLVGGRSLPVCPDGFLGLRFLSLPEGRNRSFFFLEADRSTMTTARFVTKLEAYAAWRATDRHTRLLGIRNFRVLTVVKSQARQRSLLEATSRSDALRASAPAFWFTSQERFGSGSSAVLSTIWETLDSPGEWQSILPDAALLCDAPRSMQNGPSH